MTDTDFHQAGPGPLRAAAGAAELAQAVSGLVSIDGYRLADSDPLVPLASDIARSMTEAGLAMHHCTQYHPLYRLGGVCLLAVPAESGTCSSGIAVSWTAHNLLQLDWDRVRNLRRYPAGHEHRARRRAARLRLPDRAVRVRRRLARHRLPWNGAGQ